MKDASYKEILKGLSELKNYIQYNIQCNRVISDESLRNETTESLNELVRISKLFRRKKIFEYNSYIISLYGIFERFLENIISDYLEGLCSVVNEYSLLPNEILENNLSLNIEILRNLSNPKFNSVSPKSIVSNLNDCLNNNNAIINHLAFQHHPYNFKQSIISEYFANVGITSLSGLLKLYHPLKPFLEAKFGNIANLSSKILYKEIDDLSQRRNDVSHGVENIELLNPSLVLEYLEFIELYSTSLFNILKNELNKHLFLNTKENFRLITVIDNRIICGSIKNITVSKGDYLIIEKAGLSFPKYLYSKIVEIQIEKIPHDKILITEETNVALRIEGNVRENALFKIDTAQNIALPQ